MEKIQILTPYKIESLERIDVQFATINHVREWNVLSKCGKNPLTGDFWAKGLKSILGRFIFSLTRNIVRRSIITFRQRLRDQNIPVVDI